MVMDVNQTNCDHFTIHATIKSLYCILETGIKCDNYTSVKKEDMYGVENEPMGYGN